MAPSQCGCTVPTTSLIGDVGMAQRSDQHFRPRVTVSSRVQPIAPALGPQDLSPGLASRVHWSISTRENDVLQLIVQGLTDKEIASQLGIAPSTVHQHTRHLLLKLGASNRVQLATTALRFGAESVGQSAPAASGREGAGNPDFDRGQEMTGPRSTRSAGSQQDPSAWPGGPASSKRADPPRRAAKRRRQT